MPKPAPKGCARFYVVLAAFGFSLPKKQLDAFVVVHA
jgi:hypothetical protein